MSLLKKSSNEDIIQSYVQYILIKVPKKDDRVLKFETVVLE